MSGSWSRIWIGLYVVVLATIVVAMLYARRQAVRVYGSAEATRQWREWVDEARRQEEGEGPVYRRAPKSPRPPAAVLMQEYFGVCLAGGILLGSALYWSLAFMIHGALFHGGTPQEERIGPRP